MRIIDADALKTIKSIQSADFNSIETIRQWIDSAPSIEIIRCGECSKRKKNKFCLEHMRYEKDDEGYCSYGEREDE